MWDEQDHDGMVWGLDHLLSWPLGQLHPSEMLMQRGLWAAGKQLGGLDLSLQSQSLVKNSNFDLLSSLTSLQITPEGAGEPGPVGSKSKAVVS